MAALEYRRLSLLAQTAYARLLDLLQMADDADVEAGTPVQKIVKGRRYWYVQRSEGGKKVQRYIGPDTPETEATVERLRRHRQSAATRAELIAMARAGGAHVIAGSEADVLGRLAPVFRKGAVLVGSHAFMVIGSSLGVRWKEPVGATEVEILTPMVGRTKERPVEIKALGVAATPLRSLDYVIEDAQPGAVMGGSGVLVNVPRPGRFALHKLLVASRRASTSLGRSKAPKDRAQASALLRLLLVDLPGEISLAWKALEGRGKAWRQGVLSSLRMLDPELAASLHDLGIG